MNITNIKFYICAFITVIFVMCIGKIYAADNIILDKSRFPPDWSLEKTIDVPQSNLPAISVKLGGEITDLKNYFFNAGGARLQINIIQCKTEQDARNIYEKLLSIRQNTDFCRVKGVSVIEYVCQNLQVINKAHEVLGLNDDATVQWKVRLLVAPLVKIDYMKWNELFNMLASYHNNPSDRQLAQKIKRFSRFFVFSETFYLRTVTDSNEAPEYTFSNEPIKVENQADITQYYFENSLRILDIPCIEFEGIIPVKAFAAYMPGKGIDSSRLTKATKFWPVDDRDIKALVSNITSSAESAKQKVERILLWVNANIEYKGEIAGSRYGVRKVLNQGYGHCWDKSDVFITLCRAAGVPARQISGWLNNVSGHIWAQVYITDEGWVSVDSTVSWLGTSADYIPFVISEDGDIPFVYWDFPVVVK